MSNAIFIPGFAETHAAAEPLANELMYGDFALYDCVDIVPVADAIAKYGRNNNVFAGKHLITHSAGIMPDYSAKSTIALNGPEPTPLRKTLVGAIKVGNNAKKTPLEEGVELLSPIEQGIDLARHPVINASIPWGIRKFSTARALVERKRSPWQIVAMFSATDDEFTFYRGEAVDYARNNGVDDAYVYPGLHNDAMLRPRHVAEFIFSKLSDRL